MERFANGLLEALGCENAYSRLQDEESRMLYQAKLDYYLTESPQYLWNLSYISAFNCGARGDSMPPKGSSFTQCFQYKELLALSRQSGGAAIWGAGGRCRWAIELFRTLQIPVKYIVDSDVRKHNTEVLGIHVVSPTTLFNDCSSDRIPIYIDLQDTGMVDQIVETLKRNGVDNSLVYHNPYQLLFGTFNDSRMYFGVPFMKPVPNEVYLDCGTFTGETARDFAHFCHSAYEKIYCFEPNSGTMPRLYKNLKKWGIDEKTVVIEKGVWSKDTSLHFANGLSAGSFVFEGEMHAKEVAEGVFSSVQIDCCAIDTVVPADEKVTYIKMDIEGSELEALKGARQTIQRCKPRLAISIYHKPEDIVTMPNYLLEIVPEYKFYIRHFTSFWWDTVLYAVVED